MKASYTIDGGDLSAEESSLFMSLKGQGDIIDSSTFSENVELDTYLDEDETVDDIIAEDPDVCFYSISNELGDYYGYKTMGLDVVFSMDGLSPELPEEQSDLVKQMQRDNMAWVLSPCNSPLTDGRTGIEELCFQTEKLKCYEGSNDSTRFVVMKNDQAVAGIEVVDNTINTLYTHSEFRNQGLASQAVNYAKMMFPELQHSSSKTDDGKAFIEKFESKKDQNGDSLGLG